MSAVLVRLVPIFFLKLCVSLTDSSHISPCGKLNITDHSGTISSPNYPNQYPSQVECEWNILSPSQSALKIEILDLDLFDDCNQNWLSVPYEGGHGNRVLCERKAPDYPILVSQRLTKLKYFSSEYTKNNRGFSLRYTVEPVSCGQQEIHCRNGDCVSNSSRCNGIKECGDGSDEDGCYLMANWCSRGTTPCPSSPKRCYSLSEHSCDGEFYCPRGDDEVNCAPGCPNQIACSSGDGCYDPSQRCNGIRNCRDNSDETDCVTIGCGPLEFICRNGGCVAASSLCDGVDDCGDASDEQHCSKSTLMAVVTLGLLVCVFLSCIGLSCLYRFYAIRLRASTAFFQIDPERIDNAFPYREPPPSYSAAVSESVHRIEETQVPPTRRHRRRQRRRRPHGEPRTAMQPLVKPRVLSQLELAGHVLEPQWCTPASSPSQSPSRQSVTSSTSLEDLPLR